MMKEIKYNGFTATPSDYECNDGDLATSINLVPENGALAPVMPPDTVLQLEAPKTVVFIHTTSTFRHYIILDTSSKDTFFTDGNLESSQTFQHLHSFKGMNVYSFNAIGNTLITLTDKGIHYLLWKSTTEGYLYLGTHLPECPISFGLQGEMVKTDEFTISFDNIPERYEFSEFSDSNKTKITEQVLARVNKFIADNSTNKGKFIYPFFVRYAFRLYDGTLAMHSAPILMIASTGIAPQAFCKRLTGEDGAYKKAILEIAAAIHTLDYAVIKQASINELAKWKDIIRSVDVFVSQPIYTYDQNGTCTRFADIAEDATYCVCKHTNQKASTEKYPVRYQKNEFTKLYAFTFSTGGSFGGTGTGSGFTFPAYRLLLPGKTEDSVKEDIRSTSQFYLLKSIKTEQLTTTRTKLEVPEDYLQSLVTREVMTDDYDSQDSLIPKYSFAYNSRLNLANLHKTLFNGYNAGTQFGYTDGHVGYYETNPPTILDGKAAFSVYYYIKQDGKEIVVKGDYFDMARITPTLFLFYPNINAYKAVIVMEDTFQYPYEVQLEQHSFLNGAFYFGGWDNPPASSVVPTVSTLEERTVNIPNKIYTSEVNNPFYFPVKGINTVGTGSILGISSAVKALSQGQFGQFPLYAFTTEGVWALEVSDTGTYTARQPVTRDVCINADSITQIDSAVLFATDRGIMLISGSTSVCLTDSLDAESTFSLDTLPYADIVLEKAGFADEQISIIPFKDFLRGCRMVYDYAHQRIIVYNPEQAYAYVYSLKSKLWGMMQADIKSDINAYPEALAMDGNNALVDFSQSAEKGINGILITRPIKLDAPDLLKTVDTIIQRGYFRNGHIRTILYASRDLFNWHLVYSSQGHRLCGYRGTPYKYFRIVLLYNLAKDEQIYGCTIQFTPRFLNRPR